MRLRIWDCGLRISCGLAGVGIAAVLALGLSAEGQTRRKRPKTRRPGKKVVPVSPQEAARRKAEAERRRTLSRDLAYWKSAKPQAADREQALFHVGLLSLRAKSWQPAKAAFTQLVEDFPRGRYTFAARCRLVELHLEQFLDLPAADAELKTALAWAAKEETVYFPKWTRQDDEARRKAAKKNAKTAGRPRTPPIGPIKVDVKAVQRDRKASRAKPTDGKKPAPESRVAKPPSFVHPPPTKLTLLADVHARAGVLNFIRGKLLTAHTHLRKTRILRGPPTGPQTSDDFIEQMLLSAAGARRGLVSLKLWTSRKSVFPFVSYAEALAASRDAERTRDYATRLLTQKTLEFTKLQRSYMHYVRARSRDGVADLNQRKQAAGDFLAAARLAPKADWADDCLFLAANARWHHEQKADAAIALWRQLLKEHPASPRADRAAYYIGVLYEHGKNYRDAKTAYEALLETRPKSAYVKLTKKRLKKVEGELGRSGR